MHAARSRSTLTRAAACISLLATAAAVHAQQLVLHVDDDASQGGDGLSWQTAFRDLRDALEYPLPAGTHSRIVKLAAGIYLPDRGTLSRESSFVVASGTTLLGGFAGVGHASPDLRDPALHPSTLSGDLLGDDLPQFVNRDDNSHHVVVASGSMSILDGLIVRGGRADVANYSIEGTGGGVHVRGWHPYAVLRNCILEHNEAYQGGGIGSRADARVLFDRTIVRANRAQDGGGAYIGTMEIIRSQFMHNEAQSGGGAMFTSGSVNALSSLFVGNSAARGGACMSLRAFVRFTNCTFVGNAADGGAGVTAWEPLGGVFTSCIFDSNGPSPLLSASELRIFTMLACLVNGPISGHVLTSASALGGGYLQTATGFVDPLRLDGIPATGDENYAPAATSPAIDAAAFDPLKTPYLLIAGDISGLPRVHDDPGMLNIGIGAGGALDIGAYEFQGTSCRADHDGDTAVSVPDIFSYLSDWFAQRSEADFDRDRTVEVDDLFQWLAAWFVGC